MRTTKSEVEGMFKRLCKALDKHLGPIYINDNTDTLNYEAGGWSLDYNSTYGGYVIEELGENGSISHPFGAARRSAREMYLSLHMAACIAEMRGKNEFN